MIREWPTLRGWREGNRESWRLQRQFTDAAQEWQTTGREPDMLYRGARLAQLREWAQSHADEMNPLEHEFLSASVESNEREALEREAQRQRELDAAKKLAETEQRRAEEQTLSAKNLRTRNRVISAIGLVAIVLAVLAGIFGLQSNQNAASAQANAEQAVNAQATAQAESLSRATAENNAIQSAAQSFSRELAVQSELSLNVDAQRSILLALAGLDKAYTHEAENALHKAVQASRELMTINTQHTGQVYNLAFSPDGKRLVSSSENSKVWDAATGKELFSFPGFLLVFSPDGTLLANAEGIDQIVRVSILDAQTGQKLLTLKDVARSDWLSMNFGPDKQLMLGGTGKIEFFDSTTGQLNSTLSSPDWTYKGLDGGPDLPLRVNFAVFSADGMRLAIDLRSDGNRNLGRVEVWDYPSRQRLLILPENFDTWFYPQGFAFSPDGKYIVKVQGDGGTSTVWDATTGQKLYELSNTSYFYSFAFTPDGKYILAASADGTAQMWDAASGKLMLTLNGHRGALFQVSVSPGCVSPPAAAFEWCGLRLATTGADETIKIWDISPGGGDLLTLPGSNFFVNDDWSRVTTIVKLPLDQGGYQGIVQSWDLPALTSGSTDKLQVSNYLSSIVQVDSASLGLRIIQSAKLLTSTFVDHEEFFKIWDVSSGEAKEMTTACCASVTDMVNGKWVQSQDVSPDGRLLVIGIIQGNIDVYDLRTGKKINTFAVSKLGDLWTETLSPDGSMLAVATTDNLQIWDMATGHLSKTWPAPEANILAFTPDGNSLLIGTCLGTVNVLNVATGENKFTLSGFTSCVNSFGFSHDGSRVAVGSESGPLKVWDWNTHEELLQLPFGNASTNIRMQFSPDDTRLMVSALDGDALVQNTVRVYVLPTEDIIALAKSRLTRTFTLEECQQYLHVDTCPAIP